MCESTRGNVNAGSECECKLSIENLRVDLMLAIFKLILY